MSTPTTHVVAGHLGEVGSALIETLSSAHPVVGVDTAGERPDDVMDRIDPDGLILLHVAIPHSDQFAPTVRHYERVFAADVVIIHSTVPPGTSAANGWLFSPVTGRHPNLAQSLRTFAKPVAGEPGLMVATPALRGHTFEQIRALVAEQMEDADIPAYDAGADATSLEASKITDLAWFGMEVRFEKEIHALCAERGWDFDEVYGNAVVRYRRGYREMGETWIGRPLLVHDPSPYIGGHCCAQNAPMLGSDFVRQMLEPISPPQVRWDR